ASARCCGMVPPATHWKSPPLVGIFGASPHVGRKQSVLKRTRPKKNAACHHRLRPRFGAISVSSASLSGTAGPITTRGIAFKLRDAAKGGTQNGRRRRG